VGPKSGLTSLEHTTFVRAFLSLSDVENSAKQSLRNLGDSPISENTDGRLPGMVTFYRYIERAEVCLSLYE
jgi:hypothetical protein